MDARAPSLSYRTFESRGMTLADLVALVIGAALVLSLPWQHPFGVPVRIGGMPPTPRWWWLLWSSREAAQKACLAMMAVAFARHVRWPGPIRPIEVLGLFCASPILVDVIGTVPGIKPTYEMEPAGPGVWMNVSNEVGLWSLRYGTLLLFAACGLSLIRWGRRAPAWAVLLLVFGAIFGYECGFRDSLGTWQNQLVRYLGVRVDSIGAKIFGLMFIRILPTIPIGVVGLLAIENWYARKSGRPTWVEIMTGVLVAWAYVGGFVIDIYSVCRTQTRPRVAIVIVADVGWSLICTGLVRRFGPTWNHLSTRRYTDVDPASPQPEA